MYYSRNIDENKINFFMTLLSHKIVDKDIKEEKYVDAVISEAIALAVENKSFFEVDREMYPIVISLYDHDKEYLKSLNIHKLTRSDYEKMYKMLLNEPEFI